jgi:MFS family permease
MLVTRVGVKPVLIVGLALLGGGLAYYTQIPVNGSYFANLFPGFLLTGVGLGFAFGGVASPAALTDGFRLAFWVGVGFAVIALATTLVVVKRGELRLEAEPGDSRVAEADDEQVAA